MQLKITIEWVDDDDTTQQREVALIERDQLNAATCGLSMAEAKSILANMQQALVTVQAEEYVRQHYRCEHCGDRLRGNGQHSIVLRTLFGRLRLPSPRFRSCRCQAFSSSKKTLSPLAAILPERTTPELSYLECKWPALLSYGMTTRLLSDLLPLDKPISTAVLSRQVSAVAERSEAEIGSEERVFMDASGWQIARLPIPPIPPIPPTPLTVGINGGWVHGREGKRRKAGSFELIVGKSMTQAGRSRRFGFVNGYDKKPRRRLFEVLRDQGMQLNQQVTFLSDGGDTVRGLQQYLNPQAEYVLDWFHLTMRITQLRQMVRSEASRTAAKKARQQDSAYIERQLERTKWYLWHGNVFSGLKALQRLKVTMKVAGGSEWQEPRWFK